MDPVKFVPEVTKEQIDADIAMREQVHRANIKRLSALRVSAETLGVAARLEPLVMLAQGDSWFDYPLDGNSPTLQDTDTIAQLRRLGSTPPVVLNLAHYGETSVDEMSLSKQQRIIQAIGDPSNWVGGKPDAILFSAGGNDVAGEQFCIFLDFNNGHAPGLNTDRFNKMLGGVEASYLELFLLRDRMAPGVPIFGHCYDFPIPDGRHPLCVGPWLKPSLDFCNWSVAQGTRIAHDALAAFRTMQMRLAADPHNNFTLVDTQGTLTAAEWANELHPVSSGFVKIAQKFQHALAQKFPGRI
jgi:hypothetical protein